MKKSRKKIIKPETHNIINIESKTSNDNITLTNMEGYLKDRLYFVDYFDDAKVKKFLKKVEALVRQHDGYKSFISSCKDKGLTRCAIFGNIQETKKVKIEIHHYPFTLYDIAFNELMMKINNKEKFTSISLAKDIMNLHHEGLISVVPLCKTAHQLVHDGVIFVNLNSCAGDLGEYVDRYECIMDRDIKVKYNQILEMTSNNISYSDNDLLKAIKVKSSISEEDISVAEALNADQDYIDTISLKKLNDNANEFNNEEE